MTHWLAIAVPTPAHSRVGGLLTYRSEQALPAGSLVRVPLGQRELLGVVWDADLPPPDEPLASQARAVIAALDGVPPLGAPWRRLIDFSARYYQRRSEERRVGKECR